MGKYRLFDFYFHKKWESLFDGVYMQQLNPWFITGFMDAEGSFGISVRKILGSRLGWTVGPSITIGLHPRDEEILKQIRDFFGVGYIYKKQNSIFWVVSSLEQISKLIPHFDKYCLITQKYADYLLFKQVITMLLKKEHLTSKGLQAIVNIRATLNKGLSPSLKEAFPDAVAVPRPLGLAVFCLDPYWLRERDALL